MSALLTIDFVALALFAGFCVARVIPACSTSVFRSRLWQFRDELADEIRANAYRDPERAKTLLREVECIIEKAKDVTAGRALYMQIFGRRLRSFPQDFPLDGICAQDRERLARHCDWLEWALSRHIYLGSPLGWLLLVGVATLSLLISIFERPFNHSGNVFRNTRSRVRDEVDPRLTLFDLNREAIAHGRELNQMV
ncbi:MAG TPA: hypothetical protein VK707_04420 [Solirubrobacteraceae bacterium]|jgi:hypothetical protein|nr:hypothetical protein [Solirubrobacteraceae bacterium]